MKKNKKNGFTLVELLAVIVILAIILVIAVPKVMDVIKDSKKATLESTAKMIASTAEKVKVQNDLLGKTEKFECKSIAKINDIDYANCDIDFDGNTAKVTIQGSGKFEGLYVCGGTKTNATATSNGCSASKLTVDLDGGNDNNTQYNAEYNAGATVTLTAPTKEYFEFKGWTIVSGTDASVEGNTLTIGKTDTEVKAIWEDTRTFTNISITSSNRSVIGYTGEEGEELNIPDVFYSEAEGKWYKVTSIGEGAFESCSKLISITIPNSVTFIGDWAFTGCSSLTSIIIPNSVTSIGNYAFYGCSNLTSVTIPNSVTSIGGYAFQNCSSLTSITIQNGVTSIGESVFDGCTNVTSITIPDSVTRIGNYAFRGCSSLASITIPNSVTKIGNSAFRGCSSLASITIPNSVTSIGNSAFFGCSNLTSIIIPNSVTSIGDYTFQNCSSLTSITIPNSVTRIGNYAFQNCSNLTSITIPNSVTSIGYSAFYNSNNLKDVYYTGKEEEWNSISIGIDNTPLTDATKHYESVVE